MGAMKERLQPAHSPDSGTGSATSVLVVVDVPSLLLLKLLPTQLADLVAVAVWRCKVLPRNAREAKEDNMILGGGIEG